MMMAVLLCFGIVPSNAFAAEYDYDGYISMIAVSYTHLVRHDTLPQRKQWPSSGSRHCGPGCFPAGVF